MDAIIDAVNKGAIHRYIAKPWDAKDFLETIKAGLKKYELVLENELFLKRAKGNEMALGDPAYHKENVIRLLT